MLSLLLQAVLPLLSLLALAGPTLAADGPKPDLHHTLFDNLPSKIFYFDDTSVSRPCYPESVCLDRGAGEVESVGWAGSAEGATGAAAGSAREIPLETCPRAVA